MEGDTLSGLGNGTQVDNKVLQTFQKSFGQVQNILDQNRLLINEINQNHESKIPDNLSRNVGLIRELNNNIR
ncbi:Elf4 domain-containing protein, partial [Staphylococcus aureus]|nr:Elf4 domain-containing protein [Staphylococcus aureus]